MQSETITLYSTGCPKCKVLITKLNGKNIKYRVVSNIEDIKDKGISTVPVLEIDGAPMQFTEAIQWVNER